jgi:hypothetical protein
VGEPNSAHAGLCRIARAQMYWVTGDQFLDPGGLGIVEQVFNGLQLGTSSVVNLDAAVVALLQRGLKQGELPFAAGKAHHETP